MNDNHFNNHKEGSVIPFEDEFGNKVEFELVDAFEYANNDYVALLPPDDGEDEAEVLLMRIEHEADDDVLVYIEDDEELDNAFEVFKDRVSDEYDFLDE